MKSGCDYKCSLSCWMGPALPLELQGSAPALEPEKSCLIPDRSTQQHRQFPGWELQPREGFSGASQGRRRRALADPRSCSVPNPLQDTGTSFLPYYIAIDCFFLRGTGHETRWEHARGSLPALCRGSSRARCPLLLRAQPRAGAKGSSFPSPSSRKSSSSGALPPHQHRCLLPHPLG